LGGQFKSQLAEQQLQLRFRLGVAGEHELPAVGGRDVHVDHLHGSEFLEHPAWREAGRQSMQPPTERHVQAIREEGDEDMRLDPCLLLVEDRSQRQVVLESFKGLLHRDQLQIIVP
jgi:hypothetical protein